MKTELRLLMIIFSMAGIEAKAQPIYCATNLHSALCGNSASGNINSVSISNSTLSNASGCSDANGNAYTTYPAVGSTTTSLTCGSTDTLSVVLENGAAGITADVSLWIDYNQNGIFEASEWTDIGRNVPSQSFNIKGNFFTVPINSVLGQTGIRIRTRYAGTGNDATDACSSFSSGETEDYIITIVGATGLNKIKPIQSSATIFPNPGNGLFSIVLENTFGANEVEIFNTIGENIYNSKINSNQAEIDLSSIAKGVYFYNVTNEKGIVGQGKFIIK
jgi:hypothetical protein